VNRWQWIEAARGGQSVALRSEVWRWRTLTLCVYAIPRGLQELEKLARPLCRRS